MRKTGVFSTLALLLVGIFLVPGGAIAATEAELLAAEKEAQQQIAALSTQITGLKQQGASLGRDINLLEAEIKKASLGIKARNSEISRLGTGIAQKTSQVFSLSQRLDRERGSLSQIIRNANAMGDTSLAEIVLSGSQLSDLMSDLDEYESVQEHLLATAAQVKAVRNDADKARAALEEARIKEADAKAALEQAKRTVEVKQTEKSSLLSRTKNQEKQYEKVKKDAEKHLAEIRAALFALRDTGNINFGQAYDLAKMVGGVTGVRPAFLLAIFQQETNLGQNQGSCYLKDTATGSGVIIKSGAVVDRVMKPDRDVQPFLTITKELGRDPFATRVSCAQSAGYGGAMGPGQFIPSTWILLRARVATKLGIATTDPWRARDAFMASGLMLADAGASSQSYSAEKDAACRYFSGRRCSASAWANTYGTSVMSRATKIQETMIDPLEGN